MKQILIIAGLIFLFFGAKSQTSFPDLTNNSDVMLSFNSKGAGTPSGDFLKLYFSQLLQKDKIKVNAYILGGCGREGEYKVFLFYKSGSKKKIKEAIKKLKLLINHENSANSSNGSNKGSIEIAYNITPASINFCRGKLEKLD